MRKGLFSVLSSGAIVLALGISTSAATATTAATWTIKPGGTVTGTSGTITVTDTTTGAQMKCTSSSLGATLKSGSGKINPIGQITAVAYNSCTTAGVGAGVTATASSTNPWHLRGSTYSSGVTHGSIGNAGTSFSITGPLGTCSGIVAGTSATTPGKIGVTYKNANGSLIMHGGNLHAWNVTGQCLGSLHTGDPMTVVGTYIISPRQTITSP